MAPPLIALRSVMVTHGGRPLFEDLSLALAPGERACLVGRNGAGKSTVLRLLAGLREPDGGERFVQPAARIGYVPQEPEREPDATALDHAMGGVPPDRADDARHLAEAALDGLGIAADVALDSLSGGAFRRVALARALAGDPDMLLLDEPTNHLDLPTILALEDRLAARRGGFLIISHDRAFLSRLCRRTHWLDRGQIRSADHGIDRFDEWAERIAEEDARDLARLETRIADEERYRQRGVTARRRRNQRRVRLLAELRAEKADRVGQMGTARISAGSAGRSGKLVVEAEVISKRYVPGSPPVITGFSTRILRGERVGVIGPNGAGKTTLIRLLTGELEPDAGSLRFGSGLDVVHVDQHRGALDPEKTPWEILSPGGGDSIEVDGRPRHVVSYLRDYLFADAQARAKVSTLSGGERNRLLLAKALARPGTLLVLDEPTNDLDLETLEVLEDVLAAYEGTLLLVSHDRDFVDRICTSVIALEGDGRAAEFVGGYSDYLAQRTPAGPETKPERTRAKAPPREKRVGKLSYKDQRELDGLPERIAGIETRIGALEAELADPQLFTRSPERFASVTEALEAARAELAVAEDRWLELEGRREALAAGDVS